MNRPRRLAAARLLACAATLGFGLYTAWACSPWFAAWMLEDEAHLTASPVTYLRDELGRSDLRSEFRAEVGDLDQALTADLADLDDVLRREGAGSARREERRRELVDYRRYLSGVIPAGTTAYQTPLILLRREPERPRVPIPAGLPAEMADYLAGAEAYRRGDFPAARAAWERLLARPAEERRRRSTWAAYMLGRAQVDGAPEAAVLRFEETRRLAGSGFADSLHLAAASFGWQGRVELLRNRPAEALGLYLSHFAAGDPTATASLRIAAARVFADPAALDAAVATPRLRPVLTAFALSRWGEDSGDGPEVARALLAAFDRAGLGLEGRTRAAGEPEVDRLAWLAYQAGDFAAAEAWLARAPREAPMAGWIRAKLEARAGRLAEAEAELGRVADRLPTRPAGDGHRSAATVYDATIATRPRAHAELGFLRLARNDYEGALLAFAASDSWEDAAYLAERVLKAAELRSLVDRRFPASLAARYFTDPRRHAYSRFATPTPERTAARLRSLLARRLAREGRVAEAAPYVQPALRWHFADYATALRRGRDSRRPGSARAEALFRAACLERRLGLRLFGTELEPDWAGSVGIARGSFVGERNVPERHLGTAPSADEAARVAASAAEPSKRFHYLYRAAGLAREAASLLPRGAGRRAAILVTAGSWIKATDPQAAEPLYRDLVRCCRSTPLGAEAERRRWFPAPPAGACPADVERLVDEDEIW